MSPEIGIGNKISRIVRIRQMLRRWRKKAAADVPAGHVAIRVGSSSRRFVVPATHLNHPFFKKLLVQAEEEYGFVNQGPLTIPCEESVFEEVLRFVSRAESSNSARRVCFEDFQRCSLEGYRKINIAESRPLLGGYAGQSIF
ncbi:hypothetical protein ACH5RR_002406 [Cinchona calisaya]|uniref:Small auxin up regulated protein n=1 Tax=Cinchona calisaya TaxID=153742 RepID=A0ABD3B657_9GENT